MASEFCKKGLTQQAWIAETHQFQRKGSVQFWPLAGSWEVPLNSLDMLPEMNIFVHLLAVTRKVYPNTVTGGCLYPQ